MSDKLKNTHNEPQKSPLRRIILKEIDCFGFVHLSVEGGTVTNAVQRYYLFCNILKSFFGFCRLSQNAEIITCSSLTL